MSIAMNIADIASGHARDNGAARVVRVFVDIGELSGVEADALAFCYPAASLGGPAEGSELVINRIAGKAVCGDCGAEFKPADPLVVCPACQAFGGRIVSGDEMYVRKMEIE